MIDVNDNPPVFISKIFTGGITTEADFGVEFMYIKVINNLLYNKKNIELYVSLETVLHGSKI